MHPKCRIIEKRGEKFIVEIENQIINLPESYFPGNFKVGQELKIYFWDGEGKIMDKNMAKAILEEILNGQ